MRTRSLFASAVLVLLALAALFATHLLRADPAPAWDLKDLNGNSVKLSDFKGKVVILDFWATWCPPCRAEIPDLVALQKQYKDKGLVVVGVSMDQGPITPVVSFVKAQNVDYPIVMGDDHIADAYGGVQGIPTTFVIDRKGNIIHGFLGPEPKDVFEKAIQPLL